MGTALTPTFTDMQLRSKLFEMVVNDLLGPAGGPEEEITERNVHDRYLVGVLAPRRGVDAPLFDSKKTTTAAAKDDGDEDEDTPSIPDELAEGGDDSVDDGTTDQDVPVQQAQFPSSFGLTFCVGCDVQQIAVEAAWGQYLKVKKPDQVNERTGSPLWVWKRHPRGGRIVIPVKNGAIRPDPAKPLDPESPDVYVQGRVRQRDGHCVITLFLVNGQVEERPNKDRWCLFQPELIIRATDGSSAIFEKKAHAHLASSDPATKLEEQRMAMLYRRHVEFAVGHGVSVHGEVSKERPDRATLVRTKVIPSYEVAKTTPPTDADAAVNPAFGKLAGLVLDMKVLADTPQAKLRAKLAPLTAAYKVWIDAEEAKVAEPAEGLAPFKVAATAAIQHCRKTLARIEDGLTLVETEAKAYEAFVFMNRAMWLQRTRSLYSEQIRQGKDVHYDDVDEARNRTWYPFQLAFVLLNLPGITCLDHADRSESQEATADLLFFPTGGGKTESYLGLAAYTMGLRRLQGNVAGRSGENGIAVLMRYTLRLLTLQQFQRATALLCACESIRRTERPQVGTDAVSHRPVGGCEDNAELDGRFGRGGDAAPGEPARVQSRRAGQPVPTDGLPVVRQPDRAGQAP